MALRLGALAAADGLDNAQACPRPGADPHVPYPGRRGARLPASSSAPIMLPWRLNPCPLPTRGRRPCVRQAWEMVGAIGSAIRRLGGEGGDSAPRYNFIHLRIENDWVAHCRWAWSAGSGRWGLGLSGR